MNGVVLVSPYLNPALEDNGDVSPVPWMMTLPSITAAHLEREHKLTPEAMAPVIAYTRGEYATDLLKGRSDPEATPRIVKRVTAMTGLEEEFVRRAGGRLETGAYLREVFRESGKIGSIYDSNVTGYDPFPFAPEQRTNDPMLESIIAPTTTAMVDFVTRVVGWKTDARYNTLSYEVAPSGIATAAPCARARCPICGRRWRPTRSCASSLRTAGTISRAPSWARC
jgi:carboxypeptidase C (cathepsin A)